MQLRNGSEDKAMLRLYLVETMKHSVIALLTLATLMVGIVLGLLIAPRFEHRVLAQNGTGDPCSTAECITPTMTVGSAGIGTLLSNRISADQLTVNGYDVLVLQNNILSALVQNGALTAAQAKAAADQSHPAHPLRFKPFVAPTPPPPANK